MIKLGNYKRIKVKLVKCQNEDPRFINEMVKFGAGETVILGTERNG